MEENKRDIKERSFKFAVRIIKFVQKLPRNYVSQKIGGQLLDSGNSVGANVEEATGGFSKKDFTYKQDGGCLKGGKRIELLVKID